MTLNSDVFQSHFLQRMKPIKTDNMFLIRPNIARLIKGFFYQNHNIGTSQVVMEKLLWSRKQK
jgi:hypothetical protein